jgi:hypothetical protein
MEADRVEAPAGSELLEVKSVGLMLFVPNAVFPFIRGGWNARQTLAEAGRLADVSGWPRRPECDQTR